MFRICKDISLNEDEGEAEGEAEGDYCCMFKGRLMRRANGRALTTSMSELQGSTRSTP